ncbi:MAG: response regulator transcription factor [bacterium]
MPLHNQQEEVGEGSRILIVDPHPIVRKGLIHLINQNLGTVTCQEAENAYQALELTGTLKPDMIIVEISLQGLSGIELIERVTMNHSYVSVLVLSRLHESFYVERAFQAGARGYASKSDTPDEIIKAIRSVLAKETYISRKVDSRMRDKSSDRHVGLLLKALSNRELEVFRLIGQDYGTSRIAEELCLSIKTVESYRLRIRNKLNVKTGHRLIQYAIRWIQSENQTG